MNSQNSGYISAVKIIDVEKRHASGSKHYVYVIQTTWAEPSNVFIVYRRYAQFFQLQCKLLELFPGDASSSEKSSKHRLIPFLPGKILFGRSQTRQIALERKAELHKYCEALMSLPEQISRSSVILEFFRPTETDVKKPEESLMREKKVISTSALSISKPFALPVYRCLADFNASDNLEISLTRNSFVQVLQKHQNGWWFVQYQDQRGFVPGAFLEPSELKRGSRESKTIETSLNEVHLVNQTYRGKGLDELSLDQGTFVNVIEKSLTGWWMVKFNGVIGQFPSVYLSPCGSQHTPEELNQENVQIDDEFNDSDWDEGDDEVDSVCSDQPEIWYAHSDFTDDRNDCLTFRQGDPIEIYKKYSNGWWSGRHFNSNSILTWVAANHLQKEPTVDDLCPIETQIDIPSVEPSTIVETSSNIENITESTKPVALPTITELVSPIMPSVESTVKQVKATVTIPDSSSDPTSNSSTQPIKVKDLIKKFQDI